MAREKAKPGSPFVGRWRIVSMPEWDEDFLNAFGESFIAFESPNKGTFRFGTFRGDIESRLNKRKGKQAIEWTWQGFDENDPEAGHGWAVLQGEELHGVIGFDDDDDYEFSARRIPEPAPESEQQAEASPTRRRLKLGKRATFVKRNLKALPQEDETWEVDFRPIPPTLGQPAPTEQSETQSLGLVVPSPPGDPLVYLPVNYAPNVNDLADLLADAMQRPLRGYPHRPRRIHLRANPRWEEMTSHLKDLGIEVSIHDDLPSVEEAREDFLHQMRKMKPGPFITLARHPPPITEQLPAISWWVHEKGKIEVGRQEGGFVVRALDDSGLVFQDDRSKTLDEAMETLERALRKWYPVIIIEFPD